MPTWEALGAFLTGVGSVIGAGFAMRAAVRYCDRKCDQRMQAFRDGLHDSERKP